MLSEQGFRAGWGFKRLDGDSRDCMCPNEGRPEGLMVISARLIDTHVVTVGPMFNSSHTHTLSKPVIKQATNK